MLIHSLHTVRRTTELGTGAEFLFYINDIADSLNAKVRLFADDSIAYLAIVTDEDART